MAVSFVTSSNAANNALTLPTGISSGDYILVFAYNAANTIPTDPSGFTNITTLAGNSNAFSVSYKVSAGSDSGQAATTANASGNVCLVYRGVSSIGINGKTSSASASTSTLPAVTLNVTNGTSWVVGFTGSAQNTSMSTPSLTSLRNSFSRAGSMAIGVDTNTGVSSWTAQTSTLGTNAKSVGVTIELVATASTTGQIKVYNGSSFVAKPVKVYNGSSFVTKPLKRYNGSTWVTTPY